MNGNLASITILALEYIHGSRHVESNLPKAIARFEQVVAKRYGPAEYGFGWLLLTGENRYRPGTATSEAQLRRNPQRGVELLKRSAASSCSYRDPYREQNMPQVAFELSELYRGHSGVPADAQESALWLARSILHCGFDDAGYIRARFLGQDRDSMKKAEALNWLLLMNAKEEGRKVAAGMPAGRIKRAMKNAEKLRNAVTASEAWYPAPRSAARQ
ncbi:MAG: hypothetical protein K0S28_1149 [Paucimonas sp.]|nr:hypothetical protein [Paucimonas sp.]